MKGIYNYFDRLEDKIRLNLSHHPLIYTLIGSVSIVLFWRGIWHTADMLAAKGGWLGFIFYEPVNLIIVSVILLATGLFVSYFIGDAILLSGMKGQKRIDEKTEAEIREEEQELSLIRNSIKDIKKELGEMKESIDEEHDQHHPHVGK